MKLDSNSQDHIQFSGKKTKLSKAKKREQETRWPDIRQFDPTEYGIKNPEKRLYSWSEIVKKRIAPHEDEFTPAKVGNIPPQKTISGSSDYRKHVQEQQERRQRKAQAKELEEQTRLRMMSDKAKKLTRDIALLVSMLPASLGGRPGNQVFEKDGKLGTIADHRNLMGQAIPENERREELLHRKTSLQNIRNDAVETLSNLGSRHEDYEPLLTQKKGLDKRLKPVPYADYVRLSNQPISSNRSIEIPQDDRPLTSPEHPIILGRDAIQRLTVDSPSIVLGNPESRPSTPDIASPQNRSDNSALDRNFPRITQNGLIRLSSDGKTSLQYTEASEGDIPIQQYSSTTKEGPLSPSGQEPFNMYVYNDEGLTTGYVPFNVVNRHSTIWSDPSPRTGHHETVTQETKRAFESSSGSIMNVGRGDEDIGLVHRKTWKLFSTRANRHSGSTPA
jgi:hypothetical protein